MIDDPTPETEDPQAAYERLHHVWSWVFATPIIYLLLAWILLASGLVLSAGSAVHPWDQAPARWAFAVVGLIDLALLIVIRLRRRAAINAALPNRAAALRRYSWNFFATICLSDGLSFLGLVYFCVAGRLLGVLIGGLLTFIGYFIATPHRSDLADLQEDEEA